MDPVLVTSLIAAGTGAVSAFVAYWAGYGNAAREARTRLLQMRAQMHEQQAFSLELADALYRIKGRGLSPMEQVTFNEITANYRKDAS